MSILSSPQVQTSRLPPTLLHPCERFNSTVTSHRILLRRVLVNSTDLQRHVSLTPPPSLTKKGLSKLCNSTGPQRQVSFTCWRGQWDGEQPCCRADNVDTGQGVALHIGKPFNGLHDDDTKAQRDCPGGGHQSSAAEDGCLACGGSRPALAATTQLSKFL